MKTSKAILLLLAVAAIAIFLGWRWSKVQDELSETRSQNNLLKSEVADLDTLLTTTLPVQFLIELELDNPTVPGSSKSILSLRSGEIRDSTSVCPLCPCPWSSNVSILTNTSALCCCFFPTLLFSGTEKPSLYDKEDTRMDPMPYTIRQNELFTIIRPRGRNGKLEMPRYIHYRYIGSDYEIRLGATRKNPEFKRFTVTEIRKNAQ